MEQVRQQHFIVMSAVTRWNFSVGQHDVSYVVQASKEGVTKSINERSTARDDDSEQCYVESES